MKLIITEEQSEKFNHKVRYMVNKYGFKETIRLFDNNSEIIKRAYQNNPSEFLDQFNDLTPVEKDDNRIYYVEKNNIIYYVDENNLPLFYYYPDEKNGYVYINYDRIWMFFSAVFGLKNSKIQDIMKNWLEETYNLRGFTPAWIERVKIGWKRPII